ncbi:MAG TPA: HNH endonuclease [Candidatus Kryptonia bacterium]
MNFYVAVTDNKWYHYLATLKPMPDEVNFWKPHSKTRLTTIQPGQPFLFKLKSPENAIAGGGFYLHYSVLPISMAWDAFGDKNGADSLPGLVALIQEHEAEVDSEYSIGCMVLNSPFFFDKKDWIPTPSDFSLSNQQGQYYDTSNKSGRQLWSKVESLLLERKGMAAENQEVYISDIPGGYGAAYLAKARLGQGGFKTLLLDLYQRRCAITGERTTPVLEAAHIKPFKDHGPHNPQNGLLLRADVHILFDAGYITVTPQLRVEVSHRLKGDFDNGKDYRKYHGKNLLTVPLQELVRPSREFLEWHNAIRYKG